MKFTYGSGQRPLDGYTIKRGIGRGGFGEVYYGVSDGGKEVALKLVRGNQEVELRGMAQCLNLKHPNLVNLFDLKTDSQSDHWVVMEYVAGESLGVVLNRHPEGLDPALARHWFGAMSRAITHLHEHGIVHRDLKPGNIFLENGTIKVGDYGLSKLISGSERTAQTESVGTVHYMAPEISTGKYTKQVDIYAAGIILYEMLTGHVPFDGESAGEILMKHLTAPPDLSKLPAGYATVIGKALAKNPAQRYATLGEMERAVEAVGGRKEQPRPERPTQPVRVVPVVTPPRQPPAAEPVLEALPAASSFSSQAAELCGSLVLTSLFAAVATTVLAALSHTTEWSEVGSSFFLTLVTCWAVLIPAKFWSSRRGDAWLRRTTMLVIGALVGTFALWIQGWLPPLPANQEPLPSTVAVANPPPGFMPPRPVPGDTNGPYRAQPGWSRGIEMPEAVLPGGSLSQVAGYLSYFGLAFFALRWWKMADRGRSRWFSFAPVLATGFWGTLLLLIPPHLPLARGLLALVMASVIVQLVSPWEEPAPRSVKRMRLRCAC